MSSSVVNVSCYIRNVMSVEIVPVQKDMNNAFIMYGFVFQWEVSVMPSPCLCLLLRKQKSSSDEPEKKGLQTFLNKLWCFSYPNQVIFQFLNLTWLSLLMSHSSPWRSCVALLLRARGPVHPSSALVFLTEFPSHKAEEHPRPWFVSPRFSFPGAPNMQAFGWWEEAGVPGENPRTHGENKQTPHIEEVTVLTTTPTCSPPDWVKEEESNERKKVRV